MVRKKISLFLLVLLIVSAIDSIRNLPSSALFGSSLIFFFLFSAIVFLIPTSLVAAELSSAFPEEGGVYHWVRRAYGEKMAMVAIWLQWINTMVWYPTILLFIGATAAYLVDPALAANKFYLIGMVLTIFWGLTIVSLFGIEVSAKVNSFCAAVGTMFPMVLLIALGIAWVVSGRPVQIEFRWDTVFPSLGSATNWVSLTAIMASFLGMELAGVHVNDIANPQRNFPKAVGWSVGILIVTMLFGSLSIAAVLPAKQINLVAGIMQVFTNFFQVFHMEWCIPILTVLIVVGSTGSIINWLVSPAKGLLHAAEFKFLSPVFMQKNRRGAPQNVLLTQAVLVSLFCMAFVLVPSVNGFYWFLTGLSTDLYILMYALLFFAGMKLRKVYPNRVGSFQIPGRFGMQTTCLLGLFGCLITLIVGFFPPDGIDVGGTAHYAMMIAVGNLLMLAPVLLFFRYRKRISR